MKTKLAVVGGLLVAAKLAGCSPKNGDDSVGGQQPANGTGASGSFGGGSTGGSGTGSLPNYNTGGDLPNFGSGGGDPGGGNGAGGGCPAITAAPEQIITYKDATVTDTIITYSPIALYIMLDRSGSMITGFPEGSAQSWANSTNAINGFMADPASQNMDVGLAFFPTAPDNGFTCGDGSGSGANCGAPVVEIGPVPKNASPISGAMNGNQPNPLNLTPTECGLIGMVSHCEQWKQQSGEQCVAILVTDGNPTLCSGDTTVLSKIVSDGLAQGVTTYVLGLPGSNASVLDPIAAAGGTTKSIDVSGGTQAFIQALNSIRGKEAHQSSQHISIPTVIKSALECEWKIPDPPQGQKFNADKVNVTMTPDNGQTVDLGYVVEADCARTDNAWYYDDPATPTRVLVCPSTCETIKSTTATVNLAFGCDRIKGVPK
ncbi:MAG TPA: vWA domain-containing protein [Polyangiaceae bacterium]|nr:vWA domain-containing protein [Polyangiaceae bacterium]